MEILITAEQLQQLQEQLPPLPGVARLQTLQALAWYWVEKDTSTALNFAHQAQDLLSIVHELDATSRQTINARIQLTHAKAAWLDADLKSAARFAQTVLQENQLECAQHNALLCADAHHVLAMVCNEQSNSAQRNEHWQHCIRYAQLAGDALRSALPLVYMAMRAISPDKSLITREFGAYDAQAITAQHPVLACWLFDFWGVAAFDEGDYAASISCRQFAYEYAMTTCQLPRAIMCCLSIGMCYGNLNDHDAALKWKQRGLQLAQECAWPSSMGLCLVSCGETLRQLHQFAAARTVLQQAFSALNTLPQSRYYALALRHGGFLALDENDTDLALYSFQALLQHP
ncbi:MAG: hypothetical protein HYZ45_09500, partial [Burkholderiales bacterium]|nr:hypothetical protein [Burkholderiales bacterium]